MTEETKQEPIRVGKMYISRPMITDKNLPKILGMMEFVPYRVELLAFKDQFEYIGTSKEFKPLPIGEALPEYTVNVTGDPKTGELKSIQVCKTSDTIGAQNEKRAKGGIIPF